MAELRDILSYICHHYRDTQDLSEDALAKMVYLADWKSALDRNLRLTNYRWHFGETGPVVEGVDFKAPTQSPKERGGILSIFRFHDAKTYPTLNDDDRRILNIVINTANTKGWTGITRLVYSTYPFVTQARHAHLDLLKLAKEYRTQRAKVKERLPYTKVDDSVAAD